MPDIFYLHIIYMDSLVGIIISAGIAVLGGIATGIDRYRERKARKKLKRRMERMEREKEEQQRAEQSQIETPSENGYYKPEVNVPYV